MPSMVLLELLHASASSALPLPSLLLFSSARRFLDKTSFSPQCHAVNTSSTPKSTKLYVFKNLLPNRIASTNFLNLGSLPGSSGSTSLPPPAVVASSHGASVDAVALSAKRNASRSHVVSSIGQVVDLQGKGDRRSNRRPHIADSKDAMLMAPRVLASFTWVVDRVRCLCWDKLSGKQIRAREADFGEHGHPASAWKLFGAFY